MVGRCWGRRGASWFLRRGSREAAALWNRVVMDDCMWRHRHASIGFELQDGLERGTSNSEGVSLGLIPPNVWN